MRALMVDRIKAIEPEVQELLVTAGFQVTVLGSSGEAMDFLQAKGAVDLALVNWDLPGAEGLRFALGLRSERRFDRTRLLMLTRKPSTADVLDAIRMGVDDCLVTPLSAQKLVEKLQELRLVNPGTGSQRGSQP